MPRVTRARAAELQEEAASTPLPSTPTIARAPLGEISHNASKDSVPDNSTENREPTKKGKGRKVNGAKKAPKQRQGDKDLTKVEVLEDGNESTASSAVEEACKILSKNNTDDEQAVVDDQVLQTPISVAVKTASHQLPPNVDTPRLNPEIHQIDDLADCPSTSQDKEDSFVSNIKSRTPVGMAHAEVTDSNPGVEERDDPSMEQVRKRSPNKRISRIEDSVEALDALEEEIEKIGELIPASTNNMESPLKTKRQGSVLSKAPAKKQSGALRSENGRVVTPQPAPRIPRGDVRSSAPRSTTPPGVKGVVSATTWRSSTPRDSLELLKASSSVRKSGVSAPSVSAQKRVSCIYKAPFQPKKSTKPPTRASFELPGEAFTRKLKEQREDKQKRVEEANEQKIPFKARPVRLSHAPEVKLSNAAKLRLNMIKGEPATVPATAKLPTQGAPITKSTPRNRPASSMGENKRSSTINVVKRDGTRPTANLSAGDTYSLSVGPATVSRKPSASSNHRVSLTADDLALQKVKGKEVFQRTKVEIQEREKAKKEKEEAAKKARLEAAERGRIASRQWAEKQKARKEAEKTKNAVA